MPRESMDPSSLQIETIRSITGITEDVLNSVHDFFENITPNGGGRLPKDETMANALRLFKKGKRNGAIIKLARQSRSVLNELEGPLNNDSAFQNRMAALIAAIFLLIEAEEKIQKGLL
ncbi:MAG TPA: hypothetical protein VI432_02040 [Candidatus Paceibacterota bacterium]